jgi:cation transporter-like permease
MLFGISSFSLITTTKGWQGGFSIQRPRKFLIVPKTLPQKTSPRFLQTDVVVQQSARDIEDPISNIHNGKRLLRSEKTMSMFTKNGKSEREAVVLQQLRQENDLLRVALQRAEAENERLHRHYDNGNRIILESFEGEGRFRRADGGVMSDIPMTLTGEEMLTEEASQWCDELEDDACPLEPTISFGEALRDRAYWLVGLLIMQSCSGIILARNEVLLANHPVIIYFLTMLVGAGGNAGNQASVRVIRGLALGTLNEKTQGQFLSRELKMACALSAILSVTGFFRAIAFRTPFSEAIAVTSALALIVFSSVCLGAILPLGLKRLGVDPAHSSTTIQVIMDILGVVIAVAVSSILLDSPLGILLISRLGGGS